MDLCDFGCNQVAIKIFSSGKKCCSESVNSCPSMKERNSNSAKKRWKERGDQYWKNGHPRGASGISHMKGKTYDEIYGAEQAAMKKQKVSAKLKGKKFGYHLLSSMEKVEHAKRASDAIKLRYAAGWMPKAGRCKKIKYISAIAGEVYLDGSWELITAKWLDYKNYNWKRNTIKFPYINLKGELSSYTPDFWVDELGGYLEVKGYETDLDRCKWSQFTEPLTVWKKDTIDDIKGKLPEW